MKKNEKLVRVSLRIHDFAVIMTNTLNKQSIKLGQLYRANQFDSFWRKDNS